MPSALVATTYPSSFGRHDQPPNPSVEIFWNAALPSLSQEEHEALGLPVETVRAILQSIEETDVEHLELVWRSIRVRVTQDPAGITDSQAQGTVAGPVDTVAITAPLTGVYYARSAPDQPPFIAVGDALAVGQTVGLIETMKLFNEVLSEVAGTVEVIAVQEGDLVEKGQELIGVRPEKGEEG